MSDEYKVEWVKAKAEIKVRKSSASSADKSDKTSTSTTSAVISTTSSHHSSDSLACPSDSSLNIRDSPVRPYSKKDAVVDNDTTESADTRLCSPHTVTKDSDMKEPIVTAEVSVASLLRPTSLTVSTRSHPVSVVFSSPHSSALDHTVSPFEKLESLSEDLTTTLTESKSSSSSMATERTVFEKPISILLDDDVSESVKQSSASDDFKSSVAAICSFYEAKKGKLLSKSKQEPGFGFRLDTENMFYEYLWRQLFPC